MDLVSLPLSWVWDCSAVCFWDIGCAREWGVHLSELFHVGPQLSQKVVYLTRGIPGICSSLEHHELDPMHELIWECSLLLLLFSINSECMGNSKVTCVHMINILPVFLQTWHSISWDASQALLSKLDFLLGMLDHWHGSWVTSLKIRLD